jgi:hypothetical protein
MTLFEPCYVTAEHKFLFWLGGGLNNQNWVVFTESSTLNTKMTENYNVYVLFTFHLYEGHTSVHATNCAILNNYV